MSDQIQSGAAKSVNDAKADKFIDLIEQGVPKTKAEFQVGATLEKLKRSGALGRAVQERLDRAKAENLLGAQTEETVARVRRLELMCQDEDIRVAASMVRSVLDKDSQVAVQVNNNVLLADPAVRESLKALQIELDDEANE